MFQSDESAYEDCYNDRKGRKSVALNTTQQIVNYYGQS